MAVQRIRAFDDPVLRAVARPVTAFDKELRGLVKSLTLTMRQGAGRAGLAAPQLGVQARVVVFDYDGRAGTPGQPAAGAVGAHDRGRRGVPVGAWPVVAAGAFLRGHRARSRHVRQASDGQGHRDTGQGAAARGGPSRRRAVRRPSGRRRARPLHGDGSLILPWCSALVRPARR
ncbi:peptide deformylase [Nonomuraea dietziae]|uniref:peptide deformylase n=1 Tax=Nonomuraea dietziae TaxID=65515 RepID=UPI003CD068AB